jgi:hypothetical protein
MIGAFPTALKRTTTVHCGIEITIIIHSASDDTVTFRRILLLVRVQCLQGLGDALTAFWDWYRAAVNIWATWGQRHACV